MYRGINDFTKGYQPRNTRINVKDEKGELVADPGQATIHTVDPLVHEPSAFEIELVIGKLQNHKSPVFYQIPAKFMKTDGRTICFAIHKLIISIWSKEELPEEWKESIIVPTYMKGDKKIVITIGAYHYCF